MKTLRLPTALVLASIACADRATAEPESPPPQQQSPCASEPFRQFDFWVGRWEVKNAEGELEGHNTMTLEHRQCLLTENYHSAEGETGSSMSYYDPRRRHWRQHWVGEGTILEMHGGPTPDAAMQLQGPMYYVAENRETVLRCTWTVLPQKRVRQHCVESEDGGKTWEVWFDGYYSRIED